MKSEDRVKSYHVLEEVFSFLKDLRESSWWSDFNYDGLLLGMAEEVSR